MNEKVYCRNCKWYKEKVIRQINLLYQEVGWFCYYPENTCDSFHSPNAETAKMPGEINYDNKCKWYHRKWWKFWVLKGEPNG